MSKRFVSRTKYLRVSEHVLALSVVLAGFVLAYLVISAVGGSAIDVSRSGSDPAQTTSFTPRNGVEQALVGLMHIPVAADALVIACLLLKIVRSARKQDPFTERNVWRLRAVAALTATMAFLGLIATIASSELESRIPKDIILPSTPGFDFTPLIIGIGIAALAEVFAVGVRIRNDVDGLV